MSNLVGEIDCTKELLEVVKTTKGVTITMIADSIAVSPSTLGKRAERNKGMSPAELALIAKDIPKLADFINSIPEFKRSTTNVGNKVGAIESIDEKLDRILKNQEAILQGIAKNEREIMLNKGRVNEALDQINDVRAASLKQAGSAKTGSSNP